MKKKIAVKRILYLFLALCIMCGVGSYIYVSDYYTADEVAMQALVSTDNVQVSYENGTTAFVPQNATTGIIFYQGGKVERNAYAPLLNGLADRDILCVMPDMPCNLAVLGINKADGLQQQYPQIQHWYMAGHSLGGTMAGTYISKHTDEFDGIILLASYITSDISGTDLQVLSVYGSNDGVLGIEKYNEAKQNLPQSMAEYVIQGGNHAGFGSYGEQEGDNEADITNTQQTEQTVDIICQMINK